MNGETRQGIFEPPDSQVLAAIGRNKLVVAAFAVALAVLGAALGFVQQPTYTASATLQVGQVNPNSPGFLGYTQSAASLSTAFSRAIGAAPVLATVKRKLDLSRPVAASRLSAEPIPQAPVFQVIATGPSERAAIRLANVTAGAVVAYEGKSNSANPQAKSLLRDYREASLSLRRAVIDLAAADRQSASSDELLEAEAAKSAAQVRLEAIGKAYVAAVTSQAPRQGLVSFLAGATSASSDRRSSVQLYGFIGLLAGLALGCGAAVLRERRRASPPPPGSAELKPRPRSSQPA